ncbi:MAG TPA: UDP-N-acetylglucosamine 2-epimerase (non-hydrolyzing) [Candidatus Dormibacteraeota bacterium]|nr:UDP-N-acetylglucosamine 2-epimerase (non-hydrolyzing) [Candidatus Dormibacteraeota bacterium]
MEATEHRMNGASTVWVSVVGARPQFVKLAPVCRAIEAHNQRAGCERIEHRIIHTGQHYDRNIAELLFVQMAIPGPNHNLAVGSGSHGTQIARMMARMEPILAAKKIDWVIVYGDTNSTLAGALLASRLKLPLAHVEAGCRSQDLEMPEEQNRIVADHLSQLLLAPSQAAVENLHREGIGNEGDPRKRRVAMVGDVMYDALLQNMRLAEECEGETLRQYNLEKGGYYLLTLHRAENTDNPERLGTILQAASSLDMPVLFPVHPRTKQILAGAGISLNGRLRPVTPLGYLEMLAMERYARKILTDSGGVQKEAFYLGVPCVTLRSRTEWPETVEAGANRIAGVSAVAIVDAVQEKIPSDRCGTQPYGDGKAAEKIVSELCQSRR